MNIWLTILFIVQVFNPALYTDDWVDYAAHIIAGETQPGCEECHEIIACTLIYDAELRVHRGVSPYTLYPNRWHGWKWTNEQYIPYVENALINGCDEYPMCRFLGNKTDYYSYFRYINGEEPLVIDDVIYCIPYRYGPWPNNMTSFKFALDRF